MCYESTHVLKEKIAIKKIGDNNNNSKTSSHLFYQLSTAQSNLSYSNLHAFENYV